MSSRGAAAPALRSASDEGTRACPERSRGDLLSVNRSRSQRIGRRLSVGGMAAALTLLAVRQWQRLDQMTGDAPRRGRSIVVPLASSGIAPGTSTVPGPRAAVTESIARSTPDDRARNTPRPRTRRDVERATLPSLIRTRPADAARVMASIAQPTTADRVTVEPVGRPLAIAPVRFDLPPADPPLGTRVAVDPPAGVRANVMRTSNPSFTVVWLHQ